jgi:hypothetical protein
MAAEHIDEYKYKGTNGTWLLKFKDACVTSAKIWRDVALFADTEADDWTEIERSELDGKFLTS